MATPQRHITICAYMAHMVWLGVLLAWAELTHVSGSQLGVGRSRLGSAGAARLQWLCSTCPHPLPGTRNTPGS